MSVQLKRRTLFGLLMGTVMSGVMSFVLTYSVIGFSSEFVHVWLAQGIRAFFVATPLVFVLAPLVQKLVARMIPDA